MTELLLWTKEAWSDYVYWQGQDRKTLKRINKLIMDSQRSPFEGVGKPEHLKENLSGFCLAVSMIQTGWFMLSIIIK